jgi:hypothetical protein
MISHKAKDYFDFGKALLLNNNNNQLKEMSKLNKISDQSSSINKGYDHDQGILYAF